MHYLGGPKIISGVLIKEWGRGKRVRERAMTKEAGVRPREEFEDALPLALTKD